MIYHPCIRNSANVCTGYSTIHNTFPIADRMHSCAQSVAVSAERGGNTALRHAQPHTASTSALRTLGLSLRAVAVILQGVWRGAGAVPKGLFFAFFPKTRDQHANNMMAVIGKSVSLDGCGDSPVGPHGVVTEAWSEGFMVGALVMMISLTMTNMKRKVWLHKLILIEVSVQYTIVRSISKAITDILLLANAGFTPWHLHFCPRACLWLVYEFNRCPAIRILQPPQFHQLDKTEAFPAKMGKYPIRQHHRPGLTVLGSRDVPELRIQQ
jgi:hypothetical protein